MNMTLNVNMGLICYIVIILALVRKMGLAHWESTMIQS